MATLLALSLSGCARPVPADPIAESRSRCEESLGGSAMTWLERRVSTLSFGFSRGIDGTREWISRDMRAWKPGVAYPWTDTGSVSMCDMGGPGQGDHYTVEYRAYGETLDMVRAPGGYGHGSLVRVNDDVVLTALLRPPIVSGAGDIGTGTYRVYVACQVPGAHPGQIEGTPLEGTLDDTLTNEASARVHYTHLLHSTRLLVEALGCTNKPVVPAQPPASVK
ncbi:hypothetical protein SUDANB38_02277 [Streptomyces sp. enrichment culture]